MNRTENQNNQLSVLILQRQMTGLPDCIITTSVLDTSCISFSRDIAVDVFHEDVRRQDAMYEVTPDVQIIKVVLE